ncbi:MAG: glycosyltransferase [Hyphomicrobium sp.]|uniref:glycosyltransferase n=1 Tax=Hyphomicrobium sp. TaxID=82 RepID=UPI0039E5D225
MEHKRPRTSVVLGTYNGDLYIREQLNSLFEQTILPCEIIVSDDGSVDDTLSIVDDFSARSQIPIKVRQNPVNLGFGENFLQAASFASGEWIAFCDQDDVWRPDKIERCQEALTRPGVRLAVHGADLVSADGTVIGGFHQGIEGNAMRPPLSYGPWGLFFGFSMVFDRILLELVSPDARGIDYMVRDIKLAHDRWIFFLANLTGVTAEIAAPLVNYRQHGGNLFGAPRRNSHYKTRQKVIVESDIYLRSAKEQRALVDLLASSPLSAQTLFDRSRAEAYWDAVVAHQQARNTLYRAGSRIGEFGQWLRNLSDQKYITVPDNRFQARGALKDLLFIATPGRGA